MNQVDKFYCTVQSELLKQLILTNGDVRNVVLVPWDPHVWYLSWDHVTFYFIPNNKFYLVQELKRTVYDVFPDARSDKLCAKFDLCLHQTYPTGNQQVLSEMDEQHQVIGIEFPGQMFIKQAFSLFPKKRFYCSSGEHAAPLFVFSSLRVPLGGVWPLSPSKK